MLRRFARNGDAAAMEEFVGRTRRRLLAAARRIGNPQEAEDCVQAAYHSLLRQDAAMPDAPLAWLMVAVVRIAYRRKAVSQRERALAARLALERVDVDPARAAETKERARLVRGQVSRLPGKYRDVVVLHYLQGLSVQETAGLLDVPLPTVHTRLRRARRLLEGRLAPWLTCSLLLVPWLFADVTRALWGSGSVMFGGTMKVKGAIVIASVGLASGAVGLGLGGSWDTVDRARPGERARRTDDGLRVAELMLELDAARERAASFQRQLEERQASERGRATEAVTREAGAEAKSGDAEQSSRNESDEDLPIPEAIRLAAKSTGVTTPAIRAAMKARQTLAELVGAHSGQLELEAHKALAELKSYGEEGYLAVLALLRGGEYGIYFERMLKETWALGWEQHLLALVDDAEVTTFSRSSALVGLGHADTPLVRRFLLDHLERTDDAGLFRGAAGALGTLGEAEGARFIADKLHRQGWNGIRAHLFVALGGMGGDEARRIIVEYLDDEDATADLFYAVSALVRIDPDAAAVRAARILDGPRGARLSKIGRKYMEIWARR